MGDIMGSARKCPCHRGPPRMASFGRDGWDCVKFRFGLGFGLGASRYLLAKPPSRMGQAGIPWSTSDLGCSMDFLAISPMLSSRFCLAPKSSLRYRTMLHSSARGSCLLSFSQNFLVLCLAHCNKQVQWSRLDQVVFVVFSDSLMTFSISSQPTCASFACDKFSTVVKGRPAGPSIPLSLKASPKRSQSDHVRPKLMQTSQKRMPRPGVVFRGPDPGGLS